ncbi:MAG: HEAT repeat domain-containing protein, partial [Chloroflexota bacterium]
MYGYGLASELVALLAIPFLTLLGGPEDDPDDEQADERSQLRWLRSLGDREALFQIMEGNKQLIQGLEAAEALAELGDVRGLDHLIAALSSPSSNLRHQSAQIIKRLDHPRGLRALKDRPAESGATVTAPGRPPQPGGSSRGVRREQLYDDLNGRDTDELVAIWHEDDRSQWSDLAFEVLESILTERLGRLPSEDDEAEGGGREEMDESADSRVQGLWMEGDVDGLAGLIEDESDVSLRLDAAEALADLGDEAALDFLIEALEAPDPDVGEMAARLL